MQNEEVTKILNAIENGDSSASEQLLPLVYQELRKLAEAKLKWESPGHSLQPTMLVHDAYIRLVDQKDSPKWNGKGHFFGAAAEAMRRILVESARRKQSQKHGGGRKRLTLACVEPEAKSEPVDLLDLDEALQEFEQQWPEKAKLVMLRYFAGLTISEASQAMGVSTATADRYWTFAKTWLFAWLDGSLKKRFPKKDEGR